MGAFERTNELLGREGKVTGYDLHVNLTEKDQTTDIFICSLL